VAALVLAGAVVLVNPSPAWACSCAPTSAQQSADKADAAFKGTVTRSDRVGRGSAARVELRFEVSRVFKGEVYADQVVFTPPEESACGLSAEVGSSWLIFATTVYDGSTDQLVPHLTSDLCSGSLPGSAAVPAVLGRGGFPQPGASDTVERSLRADQRVGRTLQVAGLATLGLVVVGGVALLLLWRRRAVP
jgi:hypothetical protein